MLENGNWKKKLSRRVICEKEYQLYKTIEEWYPFYVLHCLT